LMLFHNSSSVPEKVENDKIFSFLKNSVNQC
jgi:hypothetical protein